MNKGGVPFAPFSWLERRLDGASTIMLCAAKERLEATAASVPRSTAAEHP